jgi:hypothetical protein
MESSIATELLLFRLYFSTSRLQRPSWSSILDFLIALQWVHMTVARTHLGRTCLRSFLICYQASVMCIQGVLLYSLILVLGAEIV